MCGEKWEACWDGFQVLKPQTVNNTCQKMVASVLQPNPPSSSIKVDHCPPPGMVLSQTTLTPAVTNATLVGNVTTLTVTPMILSSTTPGCFAFNTSTCEACAPGSQYDNSKSVTGSPDNKAVF